MTDSFTVRLQDFAGRRLNSPRVHAAVYCRTKGRLGGRLVGMPIDVLLLTVTGRKSGARHTTPVAHFEIDGKRVIAATNLGNGGLPEWYRNLLVDPVVEVQLGGTSAPATARLTDGDERQQPSSQVRCPAARERISPSCL